MAEEVKMILIGDCREKMRELIAEKVRVQCCVTSPPKNSKRKGQPSLGWH